VKYFARKCGFYLVALWGALTVNFFIPRLLPGNPAQIMLGKMEMTSTPPPGEYKILEHLMGVGQGSIVSHYWAYLVQVSHLDFGFSFSQGETVTHVIYQALPWTLALVGTATVLSFIIGTTLGALAGWTRNRWLEALVPVTTFLTAMPYFFVALILVYYFGFIMHWLPLSGDSDPLLLPAWNWTFFSSALQHAILPAATLILVQLGGWMMSMRNMTLTTLSEDYVWAAEAKGIKSRRVMIGYAARNAILPSVTNFAISIGMVVGGSILMELVFSYQGIGYYLIQAVENDDYSLVQGIFFFISVAVLLANFIVDVMYGFIDPRTRQTQ
jgi:peptide/nickel transport system permease protein